MDYTELREQILDGDIVFFKPASVLGHLIPLFTGGSVSHCGFAVWMTYGTDKRLMLLESSPGKCRLVNLSSYAYRKMIVIRTPMDWTDVEKYALDKTGEVHYGYIDFLWIWLREKVYPISIWLANALPDTPGEVCSQMVADVLLNSKQFPKLESTLLSPNGLLKFAKQDSTFYAET